MKKRYEQATKKEQGQLLDEMEAITELHCKSLTRLMNGSLERQVRREQRGRNYGSEVDEALRVMAESWDYTSRGHKLRFFEGLEFQGQQRI